MDPSAPLPSLVTRYITTVHLSKLTFSLGTVLFIKPQTQDRPCRASCPHAPWSSEQTLCHPPLPKAATLPSSSMPQTPVGPCSRCRDTCLPSGRVRCPGGLSCSTCPHRPQPLLP